MGLTRKQLDPVQAKWATSSTDAYEAAKGRQQQSSESQLGRDAALAQLIQGKQIDDQNKNAMYDKQLQTAQDLRSKYGPESNIDAGDVRIGGIDPLNALLKHRELSQPKLTPGQTEAEKKSADELAKFETAGGRSGAEQSIKQIEEVQKDLAGGKRGWWDRNVGGALSGHPQLMGAFASKEKARRDKVRSTALMMAKQSDPNPTQKQIDDIMGQIYDPSSSDEDIKARLTDYASRIKATNEQMKQAADNLSRTGYSMPGIAGNPAAKGLPQEVSADVEPPVADKAAHFQWWKRKKAKAGN